MTPAVAAGRRPPTPPACPSPHGSAPSPTPLRAALPAPDESRESGGGRPRGDTEHRAGLVVIPPRFDDPVRHEVGVADQHLAPGLRHERGDDPEVFVLPL